MLQIYDPRERALVGAADRVLTVVAGALRPLRSRRGFHAPRRILLLRLERIGDLLMALPAIADVRALAPLAEIDLIVGSWNRTIAEAFPVVNNVETLDARWLSRDGDATGMPALMRRAWTWRARAYDLALNFEPDIRSNLLAGMSGARWIGGFRSGGGGALLDVALEFDPRDHTTANARRLVEAVFRRSAPHSDARLSLPGSALRAVQARLPVIRRGPLVGLHTCGGRAIKQWDPARFAAVGARLVRERDATIVLTGEAADQPLVAQVKAVLPSASTIDLTGELDLVSLAALLGELDLFVTGDTGPMHLAAAVGTPVVAIFGPSDPARYAPRGPADRVVRVDLACSPCNRIRKPPARCIGHIPDCLVHVSSDQVYDAIVSSLGAGRDERRLSPLCGSQREFCNHSGEPHSGPGAHGAPARERSGAKGPPRATEPGSGAEPRSH